ncbi:reverse transcriptase domain-containing protein [Tanacetum coccineum]
MFLKILTMSTHSGPSPTVPASAVRNTIGREKETSQGNLNGPVQQEKLKAVKACINFEEVSQHSKSGTPSRGRDLRKRLGSKLIRSVSKSPEPRRGRSKSPSKRGPERETVFKRLEKGVFHRLGDKEKSMFAYLNDSRNVIVEEHPRAGQKRCHKVKIVQEDTRNQGQRSKDQALRMTIYPNHRDDPEDHLKIFQTAAKVWYDEIQPKLDDIHPKSINNYDDLKKAFLANFLQQKKCIKDPVEIHHINQREGESTKDFMQRFKTEREKWQPPTKHEKGTSKWKQQEPRRKQNFDRRGDFRNHQRFEQRRDKFTLLTKSLREILALNKGKFKASPPMTTLVEKRNSNKFCGFHGEVGHNTDECMHLKRQTEEMIKAGKLSHLIKEIKQGGRKDQPKATKKGETSGKDKTMAILMVQPWQKIAKQRITQSFSSDPEISFPPLGEEDGLEGPMIIEAEIGGHFIYRMYVDGGSSLKILYEHCFKRLRLEVKNQMVPATTPLIGFSGEVIWPMGQISLPVKIGDAEHSTSTWMNFVVVRSPSP